MQQKKRSISAAIVAFFMLFFMIPLEQVNVRAESGQSDAQTIRVALFVDTGQYYRQTVPTVTLSSNSGMDVYAGENFKHPLQQVEPSDELRFSPDGYYILAGETPQQTKAQQLAQQLSKAGIKAEIRLSIKKGEAIFQVISGIDPNRSRIEEMAQKAAKEAGIHGEIKGPYRVETGVFSKQSEADNQVGQLMNAGYDAYLVKALNPDGSLVYRVWVGNESSATARDALAQSIPKNLGIQTAPAPEDLQSYVIEQYDAILGGGSQVEFVKHIVFSPRGGLSVIPRESANGPALIKVSEKGDRRYRGTMEMAVYKNAFTLVNELPLEQYLYGVVGSEMAAGWPLEALKAQAVLARTYVLGLGNKYGIAHTSDSVYEQAYKGFNMEKDDIRRAADETAGQVIWYNNKLAEAYYYSNAGGMTADGSEVWGNRVPYLQPVASVDDIPQRMSEDWYCVALSDGDIGYVHSDYITVTGGKNSLGLSYGVVNTDDLNFRSAPSRQKTTHIRSLARGMTVIILDTVKENNSYQWIRGPYSGEKMREMLNESQKLYGGSTWAAPIASLRVTERGPSGRVMEVEADGKKVTSRTPDSYRSVFRDGDSSLRSTLFEIEEMGSYTVLGADGKKVTYPQSTSGNRLYAVSGSGKNQLVTDRLNGYSEYFVILNAQNQLRVASKDPAFRFIGKGYGHGLGMSQYGARAMAEEGYDYREILEHYYQGVRIAPYSK